ncbi:DUF6544 family protein [Gordonia sp. DT219]|uniref:DUF6544 family protein n=1 Tax=Gordonia sp. DT219 TaxID=3416658 RepID=UPI003CECF1FB
MAAAFELAMLDGVEEPVRRYLAHVVAPGAQLSASWTLTMTGSIRVRARLRFAARQVLDGASFTWRARVPSNRLRPLEVTDFYRGGTGGTSGRLLGRQLFADTGPDVTRSAATRAVMESTMVPATLLPHTGVRWEVLSENAIRFRRPEVGDAEPVTVSIDALGRPGRVEALRWRADKNRPGRLVPFRATLSGERAFAGITVPEKIIAGWVTDDRFEPFYIARFAQVSPGADL